MHRILTSLLVFWVTAAHGADLVPDHVTVEVLDEDIAVARYRAEGDGLILWVAPGFSTPERAQPVARALAEGGLEVWYVDLSESLFLPKSNSTMRELDGRYVAALIEEAHKRTGKTVTLLSRSYGAMPVLRGARLWQLGHAAVGGEDSYLTGATLFSPELYSEIPALGLPPVFDPIVDATSIPLLIFQGGIRNNRWQLRELIQRLQQGGAQVYFKILPGVTGVFYEGDTAPATLQAWRSIAPELIRGAALLTKTATPSSVPELASAQPPERTGLDAKLRVFEGNPEPHPLDLPDVQGGHAGIADFGGKVTVVNFWATWCGPCIEEIPSLNRLRRRMHGKAFELVSVDYSEDGQRVAEFLQKVDVDFPVLLDADGTVSAKWGVLVFPSTFVIGPDGRIVYGVNGALEWDSDEVVAMLQALL